MAALFTATLTDTSAADLSSPFYFDIPLGVFLGGVAIGLQEKL